MRGTQVFFFFNLLFSKKYIQLQTVEEMYALADEIIGVLKTIDESTKLPQDNVSETLANNA